MNKKKISAFIAVFALLTAGPLTGCGKKESTPPETTQKTEPPVHNHTFSKTWDKDETKHWHTCTDSSCNEKRDLANHTFVWTEKTAADVHKNKVEKGVCSVCQYETERTIEGTGFHEWGTEWKSDISGHWHETTCEGHDPMKKDFAEHEGTWTVKTEAAYQQDRVDERTCTVCNFHEEKTIEGTALTIKPRTVSVSKTEFIYDTNPLALDNFVTTENKEGMIVEYRKKGTTEYSTTAPSEVGIYEYKITLPETNEWQSAETTGEVKIAQFEVKLTKTEFSRDLGSQIVDDQIQLDDIDVKFNATTTRKVKLVLDKIHDVAGIKKIPATELKIADPNYALNVADIAEITLINYDTADFYGGIQTWYTFSSGRVGIATTVARGTVKAGDSLYFHELKKSFTVEKVQPDKSQRDKATVGEKTLLLFTGITSSELRIGFTISKKDTLKEYDRFLGKITMYTKEEGGRHLPLSDSRNDTYLPTIGFKDTFTSDLGARMLFPAGTETISGGETVERVRFFLPTPTPAFVGRYFYITESSKAIAKVEITDVHKHDANYNRTGTCLECMHSSGNSLELSGGRAEIERKYLTNETLIFTILFNRTGQTEATYRFHLSDTTNCTMILTSTVGNTIYLLSEKGDLVVEAGGYYHIAIKVTAKQRTTCKLTISQIVEIIKPGRPIV